VSCTACGTAAQVDVPTSDRAGGKKVADTDPGLLPALRELVGDSTRAILIRRQRPRTAINNLWLELDDGQLTRLGPGDAAVQNDTRHAWPRP
jgi:hypothetical protein